MREWVCYNRIPPANPKKCRCCLKKIWNISIAEKKINRQVMSTLNSPAWRLAHFTSLSLGYLCETHAYSLHRLLLCDQSSISPTWYEQFSLPLDHSGPGTELTSCTDHGYTRMNRSCWRWWRSAFWDHLFKTNSTFTRMTPSTWSTSCLDHIIVKEIFPNLNYNQQKGFNMGWVGVFRH